MRLKQPFFLLLLILFPGMVNALGLGKLQLDSALNEPFEARIELLSATMEELDSLNVVLADEAVFERAGIPRLSILRQLRFVVIESEAGPDHIRIFSDEPIREPFLNFFIEVSWSKGRLYREYTVLLDPPIYADARVRKKLAQPATPATTTGTIVKEVKEIEDNQVVYNPEYKPARPATRAIPAASAPIPRISYSGGDYGPAVAGDTLWSIASAMRPDRSVSVQQMMLALLRANPEAFINNNINGLKRGAILRMPDLSDVRSLAKEEVFAQAKLQNSLWEEARGAMATAVTPRPETTAAIPEQPAASVEKMVTTPEPEPPAVVPEAEPELRLVAPGGEGTGQEGEPTTEALTQELALANESLEALKLENVELRDKLSETEVIIDDLQRLIVLREEELAALQQQIADEEARIAAEQLQTEPAVTPAQEELQEEMVAAVTESEGEEAVVEETVAVEAPVEEPGAEEMPAEAAPMETETAAAFIPAGLMGFVDQLKNNLAYTAAGLGGIILLIITLTLFIQRRRSAAATVIPASAFPEFDDMEKEATGPAPEAATEIHPDLAKAESEAETVLPEPGSEEEATAAPAPEEDKTQLVSRQETEAEPDAFNLSPEGEEEDPLAEVNVFLAYEHFDQAEEFVKKALEKEPDNLEFHSKLLEVYYAANNKKAYEQAARVLHDKVNGEGDYWNMAVAMWQELSPNRELFAEPAGEEEEAETAAVSGGGIVNIAGDESGAAEMDLDLNTAAAEDLLNVTEAGQEADVLDFTAEINEDDEILDVTAAAEESEESVGVDESLLAADEGETAIAGKAAAVDDNALDFALDTEVAASTPDEALDLSFDTDAGTEEKEELLDFSLDLEEPAKAKEEAAEMPDLSLDTGTGTEEQAEPLDFSLDIPTGAAAAAVDDNALDFSLDTEEPEEEKEGADDVLDLSFDTGTEEKDQPLDISLDLAGEGEQETAAGPESEPSLLDVTSSSSLDDEAEGSSELETDSSEDLLNVSVSGKSSGEDLLDVTSAGNFEPENAEDLLDVTTTLASARGETEEDAGGSEKDEDQAAAAVSEETGLDFELAPDDSTGSDQSGPELSFDGIDITAGGGSAGSDLDLSFETGDSSEDTAFDMDMDATMQIPGQVKPDAQRGVTDKSPVGDDSESNAFVIDEEDEDADHTIMVPRTSGTSEQSDEDEIATQLDLAKAYVELGDTDNARTILDEIVAVGNAEQKQQAQELLSQI